jgi:alkanesulfonate monooxygenase SsuD/methylene tetrahydromethanopterin reductase-like flavin-dependent oxidoreductase (luciferase family)
MTVRVGAMFPQFEIGDDPAVIRDVAQAADEVGYAHLTAIDQIVGLGRASRPDWRYVHDAADPFREVLVLFGFLAAITRRIELVTGVLVLPMRGTALVAKQAAEVDLLGGGRLRLGVGVGVKPEEFEACERPFAQRGRRTDEQIEVLRRLWGAPLVTYAGEFHRIVRRRAQSPAGPAADPRLDRRHLGRGDAARGPARGRLDAELRPGRLRMAGHRAHARLRARPGAIPRRSASRPR